MNEELPALRSFVLPGGTRLNAELHAARTICRRAERLTVALHASRKRRPKQSGYLNRVERCAVRMEPLDKSRAGRARGVVGAEPRRLRQKD